MKLTKEQRKKLTSWIEWQELCRNGFRQLNMAYTKVTNLRIKKGNYKQLILTYTLTIGVQGEYSEKYMDTEMFVLDTTLISIFNS